jgi:hypothetical protein
VQRRIRSICGCQAHTLKYGLSAYIYTLKELQDFYNDKKSCPTRIIIRMLSCIEVYTLWTGLVV